MCVRKSKLSLIAVHAVYAYEYYGGAHTARGTSRLPVTSVARVRSTCSLEDFFHLVIIKDEIPRPV